MTSIIRVACVVYVLSIIVFGSLLTIRDVGRPREPLTGGIVAGGVLLNAGIVAATLYLAGAL